MRFVTIEQAQPGMVLAAPVTDRRGRLLIPADACLSTRHVQALQMWGVSHIEVEGEVPEDTSPKDVPQEDVEGIRSEVHARFGSTDLGHPFIYALRECAVNRAVKAAREDGGTA